MKTGRIKKIFASILAITLVFTLVTINSHINATNNQDDSSGLILNKTATWNDDGTATIRLESYVTGTVQTTTKPVDIVLLLDVSGSMSSSIDGTYYGESRISALKNAANSFIDKTLEKNNKINDSSKKNRISIVKYAGNRSYNVGDGMYNSGRNRYNYTQIVHHLEVVNGNTAANLKKSIDNFKVGGATAVDWGLEHTETVLKKSSDDREKVVIMFTDGEPNHPGDGGGFENETASDAIETAERIKNKNTKIYTISVMSGATPEKDPTDFSTTKQNKYMHAVSSNYPNATVTSEYGLNISFGSGSYKNGYYKKASNATQLEEVFNQINEEISGIQLTDKAVLSDYITETFKFPTDKNTQVKAFSESYHGKGQAWTKNNDSYDVTLNESNRSVNVTGFNYKENYVLEGDPNHNREPSGKRLVVEITVKPIDGFIGGNQVLTNKEESGIYSENTLIKKFDRPTIDIPLLYNPLTKDATIYVGDNWTDVKNFINDVKNGKIIYENDRNDSKALTVYQIDGIKNQYVDIVYEIYNGTTELGTYTIPAGAKIGEFVSSGLDTTKYTDCTNFTVKATVTPAKDGSIKDSLKGEGTATLHVLKPNVNLKDSEVFFGNSTDLDNNVELQSQWKDTNANHTTIPAPTGNKPTLKYEFKQVVTHGTVNQDNVFTPQVAEPTDFNVTVYNGNVDITKQTTFHNTTKNKDENLFTVSVKTGSIQINKKLLNANFSDGDPIFIFKIKGTSKIYEGEKTFYRYVRFSEKELESIKEAETIKGLPAGQYTVEEIQSLRYTLHSVKLDNVSQHKGTIKFEIKEDKADRTVEFTNKVKSDDYFSDNDILVNKFVKEGNNVVIKQDKLDK